MGVRPRTLVIHLTLGNRSTDNSDRGALRLTVVNTQYRKAPRSVAIVRITNPAKKSALTREESIRWRSARMDEDMNDEHRDPSEADLDAVAKEEEMREKTKTKADAAEDRVIAVFLTEAR